MPAKQSIYGYFAKLNPIAEKISTDIDEVKLAYDHVWLTLTVMEQEKILNDTLIRPEISTQYFKSIKTPIKNEDPLVLGKESQIKETETPHNSKAKAQKTHSIYSIDGQSLLTFIRQNIGWKLLHDEHIGNFDDEHSFPFCHRTKSQINLLGNASIRDVATTAGNVALSNPKYLLLDSKLPKRQTNVQGCSFDEPAEEDEERIDGPYLYSVRRYELEYNTSCISSESTDSETDYGSAHSQLLPAELEIPKGFDFLSNW